MSPNKPKKTSAKTKTKTTPKKSPASLADWYYTQLNRAYPDARCALNHRNAYELLVATILSAQCTDARVNLVTPEVFKRWPSPGKLAQASLPEIETVIRSTGFYRNKAKSLQAAAKLMVDKFKGQVPGSMDHLLELPGVARKTANVVLGNVFNVNAGVVVDTHVSRLSQRMGLTTQTDPVKIEQDLIPLFPRENWTQLAHLLIAHGRKVCNARKPLCDDCVLAEKCPKVGV